MSKAKAIVLWICIGLASLGFAAAGGAKLMGVEQVHMSFAIMGLPVWFGYFIGLSEVLGAIGLWLRKLSFYAASGLLIIMLGAIYFHLRFDEIPTAIPAVILSALLINIIFGRIGDRLKF